jgi:hypothetical protein
MELNINELEYDAQNVFGFDQEPIQSSFEDIPENKDVKIKVVKKGVHFEEPMRPINQAIPRENSKIVRPKMPNKKPQISYEDIMSKMGMFVADGKLQLMDNNPQVYQQIKNQQQQYKQQQYQQQQYQQQQYQQQQYQQQQYQQSQPQSNIPQNSYIYNKYFKEEIKPENEVRRPMTAQEYKRMVLNNFMERQRVKEMKSRKLLMPTNNINISSGNSANLNKLFNFSKR